jgi:hypothetical protein
MVMARAEAALAKMMAAVEDSRMRRDILAGERASVIVVLDFRS